MYASTSARTTTAPFTLGSVPDVTEQTRFRSALFDATVALLLVALNLSILWSLRVQAPEAMALASLLVAVHAGCLFWRRRAPSLVLGANAATGVAVIVLGFPSVVLGVALLVAIYTHAAEIPRRHSLPAAAVVIAVGLTAQAIADQPDLGTLMGNAVVLGVSWFLGDTVRQRRGYVRRLEERTAELEAARDELSRRAVVEERLRIARELHDILGHSVGVIAVQAGVGAHVIDSDPGEAKRSLQTIESVSKSALVEIRQVVGALRDEGSAPEVRPAPGIAALEELVAEVPKERVGVELHVDEAAKSIAPGLQLTIYRIVQEALTNVVRHSGAGRARVSVRARPREVRVEVVDDGAGSESFEGGHGLAGMSERVSLHGGRLEAGPLPEAGFRVSATFPIGDRR